MKLHVSVCIHFTDAYLLSGANNDCSYVQPNLSYNILCLLGLLQLDGLSLSGNPLQSPPSGIIEKGTKVGISCTITCLINQLVSVMVGISCAFTWLLS